MLNVMKNIYFLEQWANVVVIDALLFDLSISRSEISSNRNV